MCILVKTDMAVAKYMSSGLHTSIMSTKKTLLCMELGNQVRAPHWVPIYQQTPYIGDKNIHVGLLVTQVIKKHKGSCWQSSKSEDA